MMNTAIRIALFTLLVSLTSMGFASAQERQVGQHVVYDVAVNGQGGPMGSGKSTTITLDFAIDRLNPDGSAHATVSLQGSAMPKVSFEGTISPTGALAGKPNPNIKPHVGMTDQETMALAENTMAQYIGSTLAALNAFADGCAARGALHVGDSWNATMNVPFPVNVLYTVTGRKNQAGHDSYAVKFASVPGAAGTASGNGDYDTAMRLVSTLHFQMASSNGQAEIMDFTLHPIDIPKV